MNLTAGSTFLLPLFQLVATITAVIALAWLVARCVRTPV